MTYDQFDLVRVPFPFTDRRATKQRPALILSSWPMFDAIGQAVMAMITSAAHTAWPLDHSIQDLSAAGLRYPSLVRFKIFTLDQRLILGTLGRLGQDDQRAVRIALGRLLGLRPER